MQCKLKAGLAIAASALLAIGTCSCVSSHTVTSPELQGSLSGAPGFHAEPGDIRGVNFKPGRPLPTETLNVALAGDRDLAALENDLTILRQMPSVIPVRVLGFTDTEECDGEACVELSLRRASLLHAWLLDHGIPESRLGTPYGFGAARPIDDNTKEEGRARNRRAYVSYEGS
jgi:hypothetical protein